MASDSSEDKQTAGADDRVGTVAEKAFRFGRSAAEPVGEAAFLDPVMHYYYLLFMFGVVGALGAHVEIDEPLDEIDIKRAMATMLARFGTAAPEQVVDLVNLLEDTDDEPARRIKSEGAIAAREWNWGVNPSASGRFADLMQDPDNFPRELEQTLKSTVTASLGNGSNGSAQH